MNTRRLAAALCFALVCSGLLTWQFSRRLPRQTASGHLFGGRPVVVAASDIHEGDALSSASLTTITMPMSQGLHGVFQNTAELSGRVAQVTIGSGEVILAHDLAPSAAGLGLAVAIPPGMRAVCVHAQEESEANAGFVVPGSRVDLLVTYRSNTDRGFTSSMVLQDVRVLAVGQNRDAGVAADRLRADGSITLLLAPSEVARLMAANALGKVTLALRNGADRTTTTNILNVRFDGMAEGQSSQKTARPVRKQAVLATQKSGAEFSVETLAAGKATVQTFKGDQ